MPCARAGARVIATDVRPEAVACTRGNAARNRVGDRIDVRLGDGFAPVAGLSFDLVRAIDDEEAISRGDAHDGRPLRDHGPPRAMTDPAVSVRAARPRRGSDVLVGLDVGGTAMSAGLVDLDKDTTVRGGAALVAYHHPAAP